MKLLLEHKAIDVNWKNKDGWTPLHIAAHNGHSECVKLLLSIPSIDVNAKRTNGWTPLHYASEMGHVECLKV